MIFEIIHTALSYNINMFYFHKIFFKYFIDVARVCKSRLEGI